MGYQYTTRDGQRVEKHVAAAFDKMAAAFKKHFGLSLHISKGGGTRTRAEQATLYQHWLNRDPGFNLAARPGTSNHEEDGPIGPRAIDVHDSGKDNGVTVIGTARDKWLTAHCGTYGFKAAGNGFSPAEAWHYEYTGSLSSAKPASSGSSKLNPADMLDWRWTGVQRMLKHYYRYTGRIDNIPGRGTISAFQRFLNTKGYAHRGPGGSLAVDGKFGPLTCKAAQQWLKERYGYTGAIDALPGAGTKSAWKKAEAANDRAFR